jgi:hypothetical protein
LGASCPLTEKKGKKMDKNKETTPIQFQINWEKLIPPHNCRLHSIILMEEHDINSFRNIVIYRRSQCKICNKVFEVSDPEGIK